MEVRCAEEEDWTVKDMGRWRSVCMVLYELTEMGVSQLSIITVSMYIICREFYIRSYVLDILVWHGMPM